MAPSLQNLPTKTRIKLALPVSSSGRFNIKARIRNHLRTLTADLKGILEHGFRDAKLHPVDDAEIHPKLYRKESNSTSEKPAKCVTSGGYRDNGCTVKEMWLAGGTETLGSRPSTVAASEPHQCQDNRLDPQMSSADSSHIELTCALPGFSGPVGNDACENSGDSCPVQCSNSSVGSDVLTALDGFDVDEEATSYSSSSYLGPARMRSLQTIDEEASTIFNYFYSADSMGEAVEITGPFSPTAHEHNTVYNSDRSEYDPSPAPSSYSLRLHTLASNTMITQPITYSQRTLLSYSRLFPSLCFGTDLLMHEGDICADIGDEDVD